MNKSVRKSIIAVAVVILLVLLFNSLVIYNPKSAECKIVTVKIIELRAGPTYDIQFKDRNGDTYYINRGIESGLNLDSLNVKVLNKTVTFALTKNDLWAIQTYSTTSY
ncbi:hypothetical protein [Winogradskyella sp. PC D3.3]